MYVGDFNRETGEKEGHGIFIYDNNDVYTGAWKNNMKHGYGEYQYSNDDIYKGQFQSGIKHGHGEYVHANGKNIQSFPFITAFLDSIQPLCR